MYDSQYAFGQKAIASERPASDTKRPQKERRAVLA